MTDIENDMRETLITLTSDIVAAHVSNNSVSVGDLPVLISNVYSALAGLKPSEPVAEPAPEPAVSIRASVKNDHIVCLEDGKKLKMLKRHLATLQHDPGTVSRPLEPAGRLSDGCPGLCRKAPRTGQEDRPGSQARRCPGPAKRGRGKAAASA
jgi:hypothetical protein